jgi:DNA invertase Pin-like site-specific DNA recombinase
MEKCFAYCRTSSGSNVDGDSLDRQMDAINKYAAKSKLEILDIFWDQAVSGTDDISIRPEFSNMLDKIEGSCINIVLVEGADRLARSVIAQEMAILAMQDRRISILTSSGHNLTESDDPAKVAMRQMASVFSQFEKSRLVAKLAAARKRQRDAGLKCEGRPSLAETNPELLKRSKKLRRKNRSSGKRRTYYTIAKILLKEGFLNSNGNSYDKNQIKKLCEA